MANWHVGLFSKWNTAGNRNTMAVADTYGGSWSDACGQSDGIIKLRSGAYCLLAHGLVDDATLTLIQADVHYQILVRWEETNGVPSFDNRQSTITSLQRDTFVTYFNTEFGINVSKIPVINNSVGRTRIAVLIDVIQDMRALT